MIVGIVFRLVIFLDVSQNFAAIHFREVQIQQDKIRAWGLAVVPLMSQKGHGRHAVGRHMQIDVRFGVAEGFLRQPDITGTVFDQKNF